MQARNHWIELDSRHVDGLEVTLFWRPADAATAVAVQDCRAGSCFVRAVPADCAGDAFRHPFAYLQPPAGWKPTRLRPARARDAPVCRSLDVDELWISELAEDVVASFEELLARGAGDGESS